MIINLQKKKDINVVQGFTAIPYEFVDNLDLTHEAVAVGSYLASLEKDYITLDELLNHSKRNSKATTLRALLLLFIHGYIVRHREKNEMHFSIWKEFD